MSIDDKLDRIIELLTSIDLRLSCEQTSKAINIQEKRIIKKSTPEQLKFKRAVEVTLVQDGKSFMKKCKKNINQIMEIRKVEKIWIPTFNETQALRWAMKRAARYPQSEFYKEILDYAESFVKSINRQVLLLIEKTET